MKPTRDELQLLLAQAIDEHELGRIEKAEAKLDELLAHELDVLTAAELMERAVSLKKKLRRRRDLLWNARLILAVVIVNALIIGALLTIPVTNVAVEGNIEATRVRFRTANDVELTPPEASSTTLTSFGSLQVDAALVDERCTEDEDCEGRPIFALLKPSGPDSSVTFDGAVITFEYLKVFPGTTIDLALTEDSKKELIIMSSDGTLEGEILTSGKFTMNCTKMALDSPLCEAPAEIIQTGAIVLEQSENVHIMLSLSQDQATQRLSKNFMITSLELKTHEPRQKETSNLQKGTIRLLSYPNEPIILQQGDLLSIAPKRGFQVIQTTVGDTLIIRFTGDAETLKLNGRQLKPNLLDWLREHYKVSLFIGVLLSLTSFVLPLLQRMNIMRVD